MPPRPSNVVNLKTLLTAARQTVNRVVCDKIEFFVIRRGAPSKTGYYGTLTN